MKFEDLEVWRKSRKLVAEGFARVSVRETMHLHAIARASCGEVRSLSYVIHDAYPTVQVAHIQCPVDEIGRQLTRLIQSTERRLATASIQLEARVNS
jgi:four helix bundle protein